jgi:hypothetical protein
VTVLAISSSNIPFCLVGGNCKDKPASNAEGHRHPSYSGDGDTNNDVAVFVMDVAWNTPYNTSATWARFAVDSISAGHQIRVWGWGETTHISNSAGDKPRVTMQDVGVDWASSGHFFALTVTGEGRPCKGDSGGPATSINYNPGHTVIVGVNSNAESLNGNCPNPGVKWRDMNMGSRDGFVKDIIEGSGQDCTLFGIPSYWGCF